MHVFTFKRLAIVLAVMATVTLAAFGEMGRAQAQQAMPSSTPTAASSQFVGSDTCKTCHEDIVNNFAANPHVNATLKVNGTEVHSCEVCHGPGAAHVESGGDKSKIFVFETKSANDVSQRCLTCHQASMSHGNFTRSVHFKNGISCISCHSPHKAREKNALLIEDTPALCYRCHADVKAAFAMPYRHRVDEKLVTCMDCHNPHGTFRTRQLRATAAGQQVCFKCHRDKEGPFLFEHWPVKTQGCTACHTPHGSTNARLLRVYPVNLLCMQCHALTTNSGVPEIPSFHNQAQKYQACTMCHTQIHGSNGAETFLY